MSRIIYSLLLSFLLGAMTILPVAAQDGVAYCDTLSAEDCELVSGTVDAMSAISSGATALSIEMIVQDIPELPAETLSFRYDQSIGFMLGEEVAALIQDLQGMTPAEMQSLGDEPAVGIEMARILVNGMNFGMDLDLQMTDEMAAFLSEEMRDDIGMDLPTELSLRLMIVDGIFYIDTASIAPFAPEITAFVDGWVGLDANPLIDMAAAELAGEGMSGSAPSGTDSMGAGTIGMTGALVATVDALDPSGEIIKFLDVEPLDVEDAAEDEAYFLTTVNFADFFQSPVFRQLVAYFSADQGASMTEAELDEVVQLAQIMGPSLLQGLNLQLIELIDEGTGHIAVGDLLLEWDLASLLLLASQGDPSLQVAEGAEPFLGLNIVTSADQLNEDVDLSAPEGAFVVPTEMLMGFMQ